MLECDAPPDSLMDSTMNPKVKTVEGEEIGARSLARSILGGRAVCWSSGMGIRKSDKKINYTWTCTNQTTSWLVHS
jgi:hypothetical protein